MKSEEPMRNINPFGLRMQPDLREKVEAAAKENHRSLNAEIVARLEESFATRSWPSMERTDTETLNARYIELSEKLSQLSYEAEEIYRQSFMAEEADTSQKLKETYKKLTIERRALEFELQKIMFLMAQSEAIASASKFHENLKE